MDTQIEATLERDGTLTLQGLPFHAGEVVQITIRTKAETVVPERRLRLRGTPVSYREPFESVAVDDWESAK